MEENPNYIVISIDEVAEEASLAIAEVLYKTSTMKNPKEQFKANLKSNIIELLQKSKPERFTSSLARDISMDLMGVYKEDDK